MNIHVDAAPVAAEALPRVRLAVENDIPQLVAIGRELHRENGLMSFSEQRAYEIAVRAVRQDRVICGVIGPVTKIEGIILLTVGMFWYSNDPHLEELFAYVRPEFRRSNRAKALIMFAKQCAVELNVPLLIGIISNERTESKIRLYRRQLGKPAGAYWLFNGRTGR
jgi:GNAT superfamily N-acetyltransferase